MDDADMRLTEKAWKLGLAQEERYKLLTEKREAVNRIIAVSYTHLDVYKRQPLSVGSQTFTTN